MVTGATLARRFEPGVTTPEAEWPSGPVHRPEANVPVLVEEPVPSVWAELGSAAQASASFGNVFDPRLLLVRPLTVKFEREGDYFIAELSEFDQYGYGKTAYEALDDIRRTLTELYWTLKESRPNLAPGLAGTWARLEGLVQER